MCSHKLFKSIYAQYRDYLEERPKYVCLSTVTVLRHFRECFGLMVIKSYLIQQAN